MPRFLVLTVCCSALVSGEAQSVFLSFPCNGTPTGHTCLSRETLDDGSSRTISPDDYYSISIESACIDRPGTFWHKKMVSFSVEISGIAKDPLTIPVYSDQAPQGCRLGVNGFEVLDSIPSNGVSPALKVVVQREDENDGLKQILNLASSGAVKNSMTTYAAAALPFVSIASTFVNQAYQSFNTQPEKFLSAAPFTLKSGGSDRFKLQDEYVLLYQGNEPSVNDGEFYVDSGEVKRVSDGTPLRGGATWVLFRISKGQHRTDYPTRQWYQGWSDAVMKATAQQLDGNGIKTQFQQAVTLLQADSDFTKGDKAYYVQQFNRVELAILTELGKATPDYIAMQRAVVAASQPVKPIGVEVGQTRVTATNSTDPTANANAAIAAAAVLQNPGHAAVSKAKAIDDRVIVPDNLAETLSAVAARTKF